MFCRPLHDNRRCPIETIIIRDEYQQILLTETLQETTLSEMAEEISLSIETGLQGEPGIQGMQGADGIRGETGPQGIQGLPGETGAGLEFCWNGTTLGVRIAGEPFYTFVNLQGVQGIQGAQGVKGDKGDPGSLTAGDGSAVTVTFSEAAARVNLLSGENLTVLFGKLKKFFAVTPETLTANRTYYVSNASGNDSNDGLGTASAFRTIGKALNSIYTLDTRAYNVTIDLNAETYTLTSQLNVYGLSGTGVLAIQNGTIVSASGVGSIVASGYRCSLRLTNLSVIQTYDAGSASEAGIIVADNGAYIHIQTVSLEFQSATANYGYGACLYAKRNSKIYIHGGTVTLNNTANKPVSSLFYAAYHSSLLFEYNTATLVLNAAFQAETYFARGFAFSFLDIQKFTLVENTVYTRKRYNLAVLSHLRYDTYLPSGGSGTNLTGNSVVY
jgi:hypothetical protein